MNKFDAIEKVYEDIRANVPYENRKGMSSYVFDGFDSPIFDNVTVRTVNYKNDKYKIIRDLKKWGEYQNPDLALQNFNGVLDTKDGEMWVHETLNDAYEYFGTAREMTVKEMEQMCDEFRIALGDDWDYQVVLYDYPDPDDFDLADNETAFFVEYADPDYKLVMLTFVVGFEGVGENPYPNEEEEYDEPDTKPNNTDYGSGVTLPLSGGFTKEQEKAYERSFGSNWRDLFNGL